MHKLFLLQKDGSEKEVRGHGCHTQVQRDAYSKMLEGFGFPHRWEEVNA